MLNLFPLASRNVSTIPVGFMQCFIYSRWLHAMFHLFPLASANGKHPDSIFLALATFFIRVVLFEYFPLIFRQEIFKFIMKLYTPMVLLLIMNIFPDS